MSDRRGERSGLSAEFLQRGYVLLSHLGQGATANVYEARHQPTGRRVALKVSRLDVSHTQAIVNRMQTAWNVGRGMQHPHIVHFRDAGLLPDGRAWIAMERLHGRDLQTVLDAHEPRGLEVQRAVRIARQVAEALQVLHRRGVVHRDVKPENVFLVGESPDSEHVKLIDLGVLALAKEDPNRVHAHTGKVIIGSLLYLAPEQGRGLRPCPQTDFYALGAMLYHLLAGRPPFDAPNTFDIVKMHLKQAPDPLDSLRAELPPELVELVHRCLAKRVRDRPVDADEVITALDRCTRALAGVSGVAVPGAPAPLPRVPAPGCSADWRAFSEVTLELVRDRWPHELPEDMESAGEWVQAARVALDRASAQAAGRRADADHQARDRIEAQSELDAKLFANQIEIDAAQEALSTARQIADAVARDGQELDRQHRLCVESIGALVSDPVGRRTPAELEDLYGRMRGVLTLRNRQDQRIAQTREEERQAAGVLAKAQKGRLELRRDRAELELAEKESGFQSELLAQQAADTERAAERAFENAALNLLLRYVAASR